MTTLVKGPIKLVTDRPDTVRKINLRAPELRLHGAGIVTDHNDDIPVVDGQVEFEALPGPAVLTLVTAGGAPLRSVDIVVPDEETALLSECLDQIYVYEPPAVGRAQYFAREAGEFAARAEAGADRVEAGADRVGSAEQVETWAADAQAAAEAAEAASTAARAAVTTAIEDLASRGMGTVFASEHGVVADGATDDAPVIQALIDEASAQGGGRIILPPGKIRLNDALVPKDHVVIEGSGREATVLEPRKAAFDQSWGTPERPIVNAHFRYFTIDGTHRTGKYKGYHGIYHRKCSWVHVTARNTGMTGLGPDYLRESVIDSCHTENTGLDNDGTMASGNGIGIGTGRSIGREDFVIISSSAVNAKRYGIMIEGPYQLSGPKIIGCSAMDCHSGGFGLGAGGGAIVIGNTAVNNLGNGFEFSHLTLAGVRPDGAILTGNTSAKNGGHGIYFDGKTTAPDLGGMIMTGNSLMQNTGDGIRVEMDLTKITQRRAMTMWKIADNMFDRNGGGINLQFAGEQANGWVPTSWAVDDNIFYMNGTAEPYADIHLKGELHASSISGNLFHHHAGLVRGGIVLGDAEIPTALTRSRVNDNINTSTRSSLTLTHGATVSTSLVSGNIPDDLASGAGALNPVRTISTVYTVSAEDHTIISTGAGNLYLPDPATTSTGRVLMVKNNSDINLVLGFTGAGTVEGATTYTIWPGNYVTLVADGTKWAVTSAGGPTPIRTIYATTYLVKDTDHTIVSYRADSLISLPDPASTPAGRELVIKNVNASPATLKFDGAGTIDGATTRSLPQWAAVTLKNGDEWVVTSTATPPSV